MLSRFNTASTICRLRGPSTISTGKKSPQREYTASRMSAAEMSAFSDQVVLMLVEQMEDDRHALVQHHVAVDQYWHGSGGVQGFKVVGFQLVNQGAFLVELVENRLRGQ